MRKHTLLVTLAINVSIYPCCPKRPFLTSLLQLSEEVQFLGGVKSNTFPVLRPGPLNSVALTKFRHQLHLLSENLCENQGQSRLFQTKILFKLTTGLKHGEKKAFLKSQHAFYIPLWLSQLSQTPSYMTKRSVVPTSNFTASLAGVCFLSYRTSFDLRWV